MRLDVVIDDFGRQRTLGEELLTPTKIYAQDCLKLIAEAEVRALAHVTGGGIPGNLVRILPEHVDAVVNRSTWKPQPVFDLVQSKGRIEDPEMEATFNMGVGMFAIVSAEDATGRWPRSPDGASTPGRSARSSRAPVRCGWSASTPEDDDFALIVRPPDQGFTRVAVAA